MRPTDSASYEVPQRITWGTFQTCENRTDENAGQNMNQSMQLSPETSNQCGTFLSRCYAVLFHVPIQEEKVTGASSSRLESFLCRRPFHQPFSILGNDPVVVTFDASIQVLWKENGSDNRREILPLFQNQQDSDETRLYRFESLLPSRRNKDRGSEQKDQWSLRSVRLLEQTKSDTTFGLLEVLTEQPVPLLSLRLYCEPLNEGQDLTNQPLLQACLKRQLVGGLVVWDLEHDKSTQLSVSVQQQRFRFTVESLMPQRNTPARLRKPVLFSIAPSTLTTFLPPKPLSNKPTSMVANPSSFDSHKKTLLSETATLLYKSLEFCFHRQQQQQLQHNTDQLYQIPRSFLLTGVPGTGKTFAVRSALEAIKDKYGEDSCHLVTFSGSDLTAKTGHYGETARELQAQFWKVATRNHASTKSGPMNPKEKDQKNVAMIFLDEAEALVSNIVVGTTLGLLLDRMQVDWPHIVVVAASNRLDAIPDYLRRPGRLDVEIPMTPPNAEQRAEILLALLAQYQLQDQVDRREMDAFAETCVGYVPADLAALVRRAMLLLLSTELKDDVGNELGGSLIMQCLDRAQQAVGASALRDAALKAPPATTWDDIAGDPGGAKTAMRQAIEWPRTRKEAFLALGLVPARGILLYGPPGCAKTSLARAAAGASGVSFLSLSPAEVYASSYVGEAEAVVRRAFTLARSAAPCVLFFDEIDAIIGAENAQGGNGGLGMSRGSSAEARVLTTFLNEMDGIDTAGSSSVDGVLVLAATNRPFTLDAALLRPGRFDKVIYVPPPDFEGRRSILRMQTQYWPTTAFEESAFDLDRLASVEWTGNMTGAEIVGACREAAQHALRQALASNTEVKVTQSHMEQALKNVQPLLANSEALSEYGEFALSRQG